MRELTAHKSNGCNEAITIEAEGAPGRGGACLQYRIEIPDHLVYLYFQDGNPAEVGVNGITNEALLAVLIDRLEGFQSGPFACTANLTALGALREALAELQGRTRERVARGVEGTQVV